MKMENQITRDRTINTFDVAFIDEQINRATKASELIDKEIEATENKLDKLRTAKRKLKSSLIAVSNFGETLKLIT